MTAAGGATLDGMPEMSRSKATGRLGDGGPRNGTGVPLWSPSLGAGQPDTILGYPYVINQSITTPATSVKSILFGDFSKYLIRDVRDVTLLRLDERFADYHQVGFLAFSRHDGDLLDAGTDPVKYHVQG